MNARHSAKQGLLWISPWIAGFALFLLGPLAVSFYYSLTDFTLLSEPEFVGLRNYIDLARDGVFWKSIANTVIFASVWVPLSTVLALVLASVSAPPGRVFALYRAAIFLPSLVPVVAASLVWLWMFRDDGSPLNVVVSTLLGGFRPVWLGSAPMAMGSLVLVCLWGVGQPAIIYFTAMRGVPASLYEAATLDGMGPIRRFWHITLPMISPLIVFNVVTAIIGAWQLFTQPYIITEGEPNRSTYFFTMYLYDKAFQFGQLGYASAMAWIQLVIVLALTGIILISARRFVFERSP